MFQSQAAYFRSRLIAAASAVTVCVAVPCLAAGPSSAPAAPANVRASALIGLPVTNDRDQKLGKVDDLMVSRSGAITRIIVAVDRSAGVDRKLVAVPYKDVKVSSNGVVYGATTDKLKTLPEFTYESRQSANATNNERTRYTDQTKQRMSEWESRLDQAKKGARDGASEAGRKLDSAWTDVKDKWADVEGASNDGWKRARSDFERAWKNLERTWKDTTN